MTGSPPISNQALDHLHSLGSDVPEPVENTDAALCLHLLHDNVQEDECPRTTHPCTAVDQQRPLVRHWVEFTDVTNEVYERHDIVWYSVIWPAQIKCVRYWPEKLHDTLAVEQKFRVTFSSNMPFAEYEFRKFKLENVSPIDCVCFISLHKHF